MVLSVLVMLGWIRERPGLGGVLSMAPASGWNAGVAGHLQDLDGEAASSLSSDIQAVIGCHPD